VTLTATPGFLSIFDGGTAAIRSRTRSARDRECGEIGHRQFLLSRQDWRYGQPLSDAGPAGQGAAHPGDAPQVAVRLRRKFLAWTAQRATVTGDRGPIGDRRRGLKRTRPRITKPDVADLRHLVDAEPSAANHKATMAPGSIGRPSSVGRALRLRDSPDVAGFPRRYVGSPAIH